MAVVTGREPGATDPARIAFERSRADADAMLAGNGKPEPFALWLLARLRAQGDRYLRYAVLDGVMAAMDDDEVRRT